MLELTALQGTPNGVSRLHARRHHSVIDRADRPDRRGARGVTGAVLFVDWRSVNALFCGLMWAIALVLAVVILVHNLPATPPVHHVAHLAVR